MSGRVQGPPRCRINPAPLQFIIIVILTWVLPVLAAGFLFRWWF